MRIRDLPSQSPWEANEDWPSAESWSTIYSMRPLRQKDASDVCKMPLGIVQRLRTKMCCTAADNNSNKMHMLARYHLPLYLEAGDFLQGWRPSIAPPPPPER